MTAPADRGHRLERLVFFSDAVFAIAITLLVLEIHVPVLSPKADDASWRDALIQLWPHILSFLLSFLVIGRLWISHHALFALVRHFNTRLLWPSLFLLLGVVFLPFATGLLSAGTPAATPFMAYCGVLLFTALMKTWLTYRALRPDLLAEGISPALVRAEHRCAWLMPAAAALAMLLCAFYPAWGMTGLMLLAVARRLPWFKLPDA